jgi:FkbM family methyltransferase
VPINDPIGVDIIARGDYEATQIDALMAIVTNPEEIDLAFNISGMCIDIGANIGLYTFIFSRIFNRVIALEANPITFKVLEANVALNAINNVFCLCKGASDETREALLFFPRGGELGWATLRNKWGKGEQQKVHLDSLDNLVDIHGFAESPVSFIKIDVEGHELAVLRGAVGTLARWKPVLMVEANSTKMAADIFDFLETIGYSAFYQFERGFSLRDNWRAEILRTLVHGLPARIVPASRQTFKATPGALILAGSVISHYAVRPEGWRKGATQVVGRPGS